MSEVPTAVDDGNRLAARPRVEVTEAEILLDGERVGSAKAIIDLNRVMRIAELAKRLDARGTPEPYYLQAFPEAPAVVWMSVMQTAANAGFTDVVLDRDLRLEVIDDAARQAIEPRLEVFQGEEGLSWRVRGGAGHLARSNVDPVLLRPSVARKCTDDKMCFRRAVLRCDYLMSFTTLVEAASACDAASRPFTEARVALSLRTARVEGGPGGRLPPATIQRVLRGRFGALHKCYQQGLVRDPSLTGALTLRFVIGREGSVASATATPTAVQDVQAMPDEEVSDCVKNVFLTLSFPEPEGGTVTVDYPVVFTPAE